MQVNPTLVPPLPEPLHCPTVAAPTDVTPGVFAGVQVPGAPVPVITEPTHWYTVAGVGATVGLLVKWLVTVTEHMTTPPPPLPAPLHCWTSVTGSADVVVVVEQVPPPAAMGPAAPTHLVTVTVEGDVVAMAPALVT